MKHIVMSIRGCVGALALLAVAATLSGCPKHAAKPPEHARATLPIFRVAPSKVDESMVSNIAKSTLGISGEVARRDDAFALHEGRMRVEVSARSGAVWAADEAALWNVDAKPRLPGNEEARSIADAFLRKNALLPALEANQPFSVAFARTGGTHAAFFDVAKKSRTNRQLDVQAIYAVEVNLPRQGDRPAKLPIVGGGGEFNVTLGDGGKVIAFQGLWRPVAGVQEESPLVPREKADAEFRRMTKDMTIRSFDAYLAYYSAPPSVAQEFLYPVYVYRAVAEVDGHPVPLRLVTIPATEFGPKRAVAERPATRTEKNAPMRRSTLPEGREERGGTPPPAALAAARPLVTNWREAGTSWIGLSGGLSGSANNAKGFVDELSADGWAINFNWGDAAAWESDWRRNDDSWVDAADFVFYTGHASMDGWVLRSPDDGFLHFSEVGTAPQTPGDLWGQQDLEWVIIAACGPLQDDVISAGGGDVFDRWDGAFDGLHQLLGYGAVTFDNEEEGRSVAKYAREGATLINAWFRAAREIQPSSNGVEAPDGPTIWAGVMYVGRSGAPSPGDDHIWLHGSVAPDPTSPNFYVAIWTTT